MDRGQLILFRSTAPRVGRASLIRELRCQWERQSIFCLSVIFEKENSNALDLAEWLERYRPLSPLLQRNALQSAQSYGFLKLKETTPAALKEWLGLATSLYRWVLVSAPSENSESFVTLLDAADLLVTVTVSGGRPEDDSRLLRDCLERERFPLAFHQWVINREPRSSKPSPIHPLSILPEDPLLGIRWREAVRGLAETFKQKPALFKPQTPLSQKEETSRQVLEDLKARIQPQLVQAMEQSPTQGTEKVQAVLAAALVDESRLPVDRQQREEAMQRVLEDVLGLGPIETLLKDPEVSEVMVNGHGCVYVEKRGKLHHTPIQLASEAQLRTLIDRIVAPLGRRVDESMPLCDARLADGSRVNIVLPPLALDGPTLTIRKFMTKRLAFDQLVELGSMSAAMGRFLSGAVMSRKNILVSGGTGSGKTTLLNALSSAIPDDERIVTIEDAAELRLQKPHVVRLESRPPNAEGQGEIPIRRLVINALRMRPDRIVIGECRGGEALDMLQAMNTGHDGSLTTIHANTPRDALGRLETLVLMAGMDLPVRVIREQIRSAIHLIVQQARLPDGSRKVTSVTEVTGMEQEVLVTQELFRLRNGQFETTGLRAAS